MFPHHQTIPNKQAGADPTKTVLSNTEFPPAIHQPSSQEAPFLFQILGLPRTIGRSHLQH